MPFKTISLLSLLFLLLYVTTTVAFVAPMKGHGVPRSSTTTELGMALENQSPELRKNVMSAAVSAAALPALLSVTASVGTAAAATSVSKNLLDTSDPRLIAALFVGHWIVTNYFLQKFPDVGE